MNDAQLLKTLTVYDYLHYHARKVPKDPTFTDSFLRFAKGKLEAGEIQWTPKHIGLMCEFLSKNIPVARTISPKALRAFFEKAVASTQTLRLPHLAYAVAAAVHNPKFHEAIASAFVAKFNTVSGALHTDFSNLSSVEICAVSQSLFLRPNNVKSPFEISVEMLRAESLSALQTTITERLERGYFEVVDVINIMKSFRQLKGYTHSGFEDTIASWILRLLDPDESLRVQSIDHRPEQILELIAHLSPQSPYSQLIFRLATNHFFLKFIMSTGPLSLSLRGPDRISALQRYLEVSAENHIFQVVYLDETVKIMAKSIRDERLDWSLRPVAYLLRNLAELNYSRRFHSPLKGQSALNSDWEALLAACSSTFAASVSSQTSMRKNGGLSKENGSLVETKLITDILWAFAVFDYYDRDVLQTALASEAFTSERKLKSEEAEKLAQVAVWLETERHAEVALPAAVAARLAAFQSSWEAEPTAKPAKSELKDSVRVVLSERKTGFTENVKVFPYILDFASTATKECIAVEGEDAYLEGSDSVVLPGGTELQYRQLEKQGWTVRRVRLAEWLRTESK